MIPTRGGAARRLAGADAGPSGGCARTHAARGTGAGRRRHGAWCRRTYRRSRMPSTAATTTRCSARWRSRTNLAEHHPRVPDVGQPMAERSEAHRRLRAGDGPRRTSQRQRLRAGRRRPVAGRVPHRACASRRARTAFECSWFVTEAAALEGLFLPDSALLFIPRALQRCPTDARLHLAHAFVSEQQWLRGGLTPEQELEVVAPLRRGDEVSRDRDRGARPRGALPLCARAASSARSQLLDGATTSRRPTRNFGISPRSFAARSCARSAAPTKRSAAFRAALATGRARSRRESR